jgi:hypothetical protein
MGGRWRQRIVLAVVIGMPVLLHLVALSSTSPVTASDAAADHLVVMAEILGFALVALAGSAMLGIGNSIAAEARLGTLDDLRVLPLTIHDLLRAKLRGVWSALKPLALVAAACLPATGYELFRHDLVTWWLCYLVPLGAALVVAAWSLALLHSVCEVDPRTKNTPTAVAAFFIVGIPVVMMVVRTIAGEDLGTVAWCALWLAGVVAMDVTICLLARAHLARL